MKKQQMKTWGALLVILLWLCCAYTNVLAQTEDTPYTLHIKKEFGFDNGNNIRGTFRLSLMGDESAVVRVTWFIDGAMLAETSQPPFYVNFDTTHYTSTEHTLHAQVETTDGSLHQTPTRHFNFVSSETQNQMMGQLIGYLLGGILVVGFIGAGITRMLTRSNKQQGLSPDMRGQYGALGGAVCGKCGKPFSRSIFGFNLLTGKLERCPHCGKWVMTRRAAQTELAEAEKLLWQENAPESVNMDESDEEKLRKMIDDTRYTK